MQHSFSAPIDVCHPQAIVDQLRAGFPVHDTYPLVNSQFAIENNLMFNGKINYFYGNVQ